MRSKCHVLALCLSKCPLHSLLVPRSYFCAFCGLILFYFLATLQHVEFLGQGSDDAWDGSCNLGGSCSNAGSLTHCARPGIKPVSHRSRCIIDPAGPQQELSLLLIFFFFFTAAPVAYGSSEARGQIRVAAAGLCHTHSNSGSELPLWPAPQLIAMPDPLTHWVRPGMEPTSSWILVGFLTCWDTTETPEKTLLILLPRQNHK